ncbi:YfdX family protein [Methylobacterium soli]|uniref:YfdX family protein n=1 Tax=Methylobacterium soli TaxID=553447 RepID=A0A6L3T2N8_9HYPH|nr:YfdX family protein [Methylobacterium soli]KAB1079131.1 YfdX family protein [Methylobacterium soli]
MNRFRMFTAALAATTILAGAAYAADQAAPSVPQETAAQKAADRDVGKLSKDGAQAFRDLHLARIAIFGADPSQAKTLIGKAQAALDKAKTDETVFLKAEADLHPPATTGTASSDKAAAAKGDTSKGDTSKGDMTKPVAWLPVDGQLLLGEDFVATPAKASAVADANKSLAKGDRKGALEKLKLAHVDVNFTLAVLPLAKTTADVDQAAKLIDASKYYEANAVLKQAEDGMRFDMIDVIALPQKAAAAASSADHGHDAASTTASTKPAK